MLASNDVATGASSEAGHPPVNGGRFRRRALGAVLLAWLVFIAIDFLFHGSILRNLWYDDLPAVLDLPTLFRRIPFGYASFLVLVILAFHLLTSLYGRYPNPRRGLVFGLVFGGLFSMNHFLALYSFVAIPAKHLFLFSLVYFLELTTVSWLLAFLLCRMSRATITGTISACVILLVGGVGIQNL